MWKRYRVWKSRLGFPLVLAALFLMQQAPQGSGQWYAGLGIALGLGIAYVVEELVWIAKRQGRPCGQCGRPLEMKSFSVVSHCPGCGQPLD